MSKKDCAFQYALGRPPLMTKPIIEDTGLITIEDAKALWNKYLPDFKRALADEEEPEMAIWIDMENPADYHTDKWHIDSNECELVDGELYKVVRSKVDEL